MTRDELLRLIDQAAEEGWKELDLAGNDLEELPPEISKLTRLEILTLGKFDPRKGWVGNKLKTLPAEIVQLQNLTALDLRENQLTTLPAEIVQQQNLTALYLNPNQQSARPRPSRPRHQNPTRPTLHRLQPQHPRRTNDGRC